MDTLKEVYYTLNDISGNTQELYNIFRVLVDAGTTLPQLYTELNKLIQSINEIAKNILEFLHDIFGIRKQSNDTLMEL